MSEPTTIGQRWWRATVHPWRDVLGRVGLLLLGVQTVWRGILLARGWFTQDDFLMLSLGHHRLGLGMLFQDYSGHLFPGGFLIAWLQSHLAPLQWGWSVAVVLLLQVATGVMAWLVLRRLLGDRWVAIPIYAFVLFCPLTLWPTQWWAVAIQFLPVAFFLLLAVWGLLHRIQDGAAAGDLVAVGAVVGALLFQERGLLIPIVLAFVALALTEPDRWTRRLAVAVRTHVRVWAALVVLGVGYLVLHRQAAPIKSSPVDSVVDGLQLVGNFLGRNLLVGSFGGAWTNRIAGDSLVIPSWFAVGACLLVWLVLLVWTVRRGGFLAGCGWLLIVVYALVDVALLFGGRAGQGPSFGLLPRYAADAVPAVMVGLSLVALGVGATTRRSERSRFRRPEVLAGGVAAAYLVSSAISVGFMAPHLYNRDDKEFVANVRAGLRADPQTVLYDARVPSGVMIGWFGDLGRLSNVVGIAPEDPVFDLPSYALRMADAHGHLVPAALVEPARSVPARDRACGYHVTSDAQQIPLDRSVEGRRLLVRIGYYSGTSGFLTVTAGGHSSQVPVRNGLQSVDLVVDGPFADLTMSLDRPGTVCVPEVEVGAPFPGR